jgi:hypothetical protein
MEPRPYLAQSSRAICLCVAAVCLQLLQGGPVVKVESLFNKRSGG